MPPSWPPLEQRKLKNEHSIPEMRHLLSLLGYKPDDFDGLHIIHIAGSKGKGSTAAFVESILRSHGLKTALFTSPHLVHPRERLRINGHSMDLSLFSEAVVDIFGRLTVQVEPLPGLFRFMTLLAFDQMKRLQRAGELDVAIVEVGMGGRFDATNFIQRPVVTAITSLAMEHVKSLGPTLGNIANHKAGIAKSNAPLLSVPQPVEAIKVLQTNSKRVGVPLVFVDVEELERSGLGRVNLSIAGDHQRLNAALAVKICQIWMNHCFPSRMPSLDLQLIRRALESTVWPGRHQKIFRGSQRWFLDGAHTIESIQYAIKWFISKLNPQEDAELSERILVFHCTHDRSYEHLLGPILEAQHSRTGLFTRAFFVKPRSPTDMETDYADLSLHQAMSAYWTTSTAISSQAIHSIDLLSALADAGPCSILITGSLYLVGDLMDILHVPIR